MILESCNFAGGDDWSTRSRRLNVYPERDQGYGQDRKSRQNETNTFIPMYNFWHHLLSGDHCIIFELLSSLKTELFLEKVDILRRKIDLLRREIEENERTQSVNSYTSDCNNKNDVNGWAQFYCRKDTTPLTKSESTHYDNDSTCSRDKCMFPLSTAGLCMKGLNKAVTKFHWVMKWMLKLQPVSLMFQGLANLRQMNSHLKMTAHNLNQCTYVGLWRPIKHCNFWLVCAIIPRIHKNIRQRLRRRHEDHDFGKRFLTVAFLPLVTKRTLRLPSPICDYPVRRIYANPIVGTTFCGHQRYLSPKVGGGERGLSSHF